MNLRGPRPRDAARLRQRDAPASASRGRPFPEAPRVAFVTDIPTPYMLAVLEELSNLVQLDAFFCAGEGSRALPWTIDEVGFNGRVIGGATIRRPGGDGQDYHVSPRIPAALAGSAPDAVVSFGFSVPTLYAAAYCRLRDVPLVIYSDGTHHDETLTLGRHQMLARAVLLRAASGCVALSRPAAERFLELGVRADRVFVAPHSSNLAPLWEVARERHYERRAVLRVLTAGRLLPRKGVDKLLRALALAREEWPGIRLRIVGTGPEEGRLRNLANELGLDDVDFAGFVEHGGLKEEFANVDAFAFTTLRDPYGVVLLEAAASGLPIVASPYGGATRDLILDGESGLVVDPVDSRSLASALVRLARDRDGRESLGRAAHRATLDRSPRESARGYLAAVETTIRDRGRALA